METMMPIFPFEVTYEEIVKNPESYVDAVFSCLESEFLVMPKGVGFVEYPVFERGYEALKAATQGFSRVEPSNVFAGFWRNQFYWWYCDPCLALRLRSGLMLPPKGQGLSFLKDLYAPWTGKSG